MLSIFISQYRDEILTRTRDRVTARMTPRASESESESELEHGMPLFLDQLVALLGENSHGPSKDTALGHSASAHGGNRMRSGFTVDQLVNDYGDVCQAVTGLAAELNISIPTDDFRNLNLCLDVAIARAVTEYQVQREVDLNLRETARTGALAHELRNLLSTATVTFHLLKRGDAPLGGSTGALHERMLRSLSQMIDRSLAEVRATGGLFTLEAVSVQELMEDLGIPATLEAGYGGHTFALWPVDLTLMLEIDRMLIASAVTNLLHNAFKFSPRGGNVSLRAIEVAGRKLHIEVEDECGGLPLGETEKLFQPFVQGGINRSGLGLGLSICRESVRAGGGDLSVQDHPGRGCVFTVELPLAASRVLPV
jgi:signal transduction histidine kinase